jgi:mRNA interferase MazF
VRRGDLVSLALASADGAPRLALVIQSDLFAAHPSVTILPVTHEVRNTPLFRVPLNPGDGNGLDKPCEVMADKAQTIARSTVGELLGHLSEEDMLAVSRVLAVFLGVV